MVDILDFLKTVTVFPKAAEIIGEASKQSKITNRLNRDAMEVELARSRLDLQQAQSQAAEYRDTSDVLREVVKGRLAEQAKSLNPRAADFGNVQNFANVPLPLGMSVPTPTRVGVKPQYEGATKSLERAQAILRERPDLSAPAAQLLLADAEREDLLTQYGELAGRLTDRVATLADSGVLDKESAAISQETIQTAMQKYGRDPEKLGPELERLDQNLTELRHKASVKRATIEQREALAGGYAQELSSLEAKAAPWKVPFLLNARVALHAYMSGDDSFSYDEFVAEWGKAMRGLAGGGESQDPVTIAQEMASDTLNRLLSRLDAKAAAEYTPKRLADERKELTKSFLSQILGLQDDTAASGRFLGASQGFNISADQAMQTGGQFDPVKQRGSPVQGSQAPWGQSPGQPQAAQPEPTTDDEKAQEGDPETIGRLAGRYADKEKAAGELNRAADQFNWSPEQIATAMKAAGF